MRGRGRGIKNQAAMHSAFLGQQESWKDQEEEWTYSRNTWGKGGPVQNPGNRMRASGGQISVLK